MTLDIDALTTAVLDEHATLVHDGRTPHERIRDVILNALADDAIAQVAALPAEGVVFVVMRRPDGDDPLDHSAQVKQIADRIKEANPNGFLLVLPESWSFRTITHEHALRFVTDIISFVSDDELAAAGLCKVPVETKLTAEQAEKLEAMWEEIAQQPVHLVPGEPRSLRDEIAAMSDDELEEIGARRITGNNETINEVQNRG